jgi:hypothetical protein
MSLRVEVSLFMLSKRLKIETIEDVFSTFAQMINNALVREKCLLTLGS